jgi:hypothetical protein
MEPVMQQVSGNSFGAASAAILSLFLSAPPAGAQQNASLVPDLSGVWGRNTLNLEAPLSGNGPVFNMTRNEDGTLDTRIPVGDYNNPVLKPDAARIVRERGEISLAGEAFPSPHNQCWPEPTPFILAIQFGVQILQHADGVVLTYLSNHQVRHIRINAPHRAGMTPTWQGDSVGHYEGDTLVIDTVGIKVGPHATVDRNGTPHSEALHVVERYRRVDGETAREAILAHERLYSRDFEISADIESRQYGRGPVDPDPRLDGLQVEINVEDQGVFTAPWSARVTYRPTTGGWPEAVCAENARDITGAEAAVPVAASADF